MPDRAYRWALMAGALLVPIYFLYHPALHDRPLRPFNRRLWQCTGVGFLIYAMAGALLLWRKGML